MIRIPLFVAPGTEDSVSEIISTQTFHEILEKERLPQPCVMDWNQLQESDEQLRQLDAMKGAAVFNDGEQPFILIGPQWLQFPSVDYRMMLLVHELVHAAQRDSSEFGFVFSHSIEIPDVAMTVNLGTPFGEELREHLYHCALLFWSQALEASAQCTCLRYFPEATTKNIQFVVNENPQVGLNTGSMNASSRFEFERCLLLTTTGYAYWYRSIARSVPSGMDSLASRLLAEAQKEVAKRDLVCRDTIQRLRLSRPLTAISDVVSVPDYQRTATELLSILGIRVRP